MAQRRVVIMGAAGRDFHVFNTVFRSDADTVVVAFTATQIPRIEGRAYPPALAGPRYPDGIPIIEERGLEGLVREQAIDEVVFAYSDVSHETVMHQASRVLALGPDFRLVGPASTMVAATVPVISVCAVRTGAGKSQTSRFVAALLAAEGLNPVIVRHPMPYGDLERQRVQRFASLDDLDLSQVTVEEREDFEPHLRNGIVVYAGVDYEAVVREAERECDILIWDGGNNDFPFVTPDLEIVVVDPLRPGHETTYHPGEVNLRRADIVVVNKVDSAEAGAVAAVRRAIADSNPEAAVVEVGSRISVRGAGGTEAVPLGLEREGPGGLLAGKRVLVIEDGPTVTHGGMATGAGMKAARALGASEIVDPRPFAVGSLAVVYDRYPHMGPVLPALGYYEEQLRDLEATIAAVPVDAVVSASPFDLRAVVDVEQPMLTVSYELEEKGEPRLTTLVGDFVRRLSIEE